MIRRCVVVGVLAQLAGCQFSSSTIGPRGPGSGRVGGGGDGSTLTVPNMFGMTKAQAVEALRSAGHRGNVSEDGSGCGSVEQGRVIEIGMICYQFPPPGRVQPAKLAVSLRVQTENPWFGNVGKHHEWRLMPNVIGMQIEQARGEMKRVGFKRDDRVRLMWVDEASCKPLTICRTYPAPLERWGVNSEMNVYAGRDPNAAKLDEPKPDGATPDGPKSDGKPKPEPFF